MTDIVEETMKEEAEKKEEEDKAHKKPQRD